MSTHIKSTYLSGKRSTLTDDKFSELSLMYFRTECTYIIPLPLCIEFTRKYMFCVVYTVKLHATIPETIRETGVTKGVTFVHLQGLFILLNRCVMCKSVKKSNNSIKDIQRQVVDLGISVIKLIKE